MSEQLTDIGLDLSNVAAGRLHAQYINDVPHVQREYDSIEHLGYLMNEIVPLRVAPNLEKLDARWHPSGFMVFSLGEAPNNLGTRRLHIWPKGLRQREERGLGPMTDGTWDGDWHNHRWYVTSFNIRGYADMKGEIAPEGSDFTPEEVAMKGLFWRFQPAYLPDGTDALVNTGECVSLTVTEHLDDLFASDIHPIKPHDFHAPTIADDTLGATLVINSHRVPEVWDYDEIENEWPDILIRGETQPIRSVRRSATTTEKLLAKYQLLETLSEEPYGFRFDLQNVLAATHRQVAELQKDGQLSATAA